MIGPPPQQQLQHLPHQQQQHEPHLRVECNFGSVKKYPNLLNVVGGTRTQSIYHLQGQRLTAFYLSYLAYSNQLQWEIAVDIEY